MTEIFIILGLLILNGLFAMAEIALLSARRARLEVQANKGDARAKSALDLAAHPDTFLSTIQIGITLMGILTGIFSGEKIKNELVVLLKDLTISESNRKSLATVIVVVGITYLSLIVELVAKRIGLSKPEAVAKLVSGPMRLITKLTYPFIWLLSKSTMLISKIFNIRNNDSQVTEEEIKAIISEGTEHGAIEEAEQEIIERVFHLGDRNITSLMTHRSDIVWMDINELVVDIKQKMSEVVHSTYPLCDGAIDNIKGVVSIKDLLLAADNTPLRDLMKPGLYVPENNSAYQLLEKFRSSATNSCFIVDEYGSLQGMITLNNILEAIVGDIAPEAEDDYEIIEREDGTFLIEAQLPFYNFLSRFGKTEYMNEGEHDFNTLAGFILHMLERIPKTGDKLEWKGFEFEIVDMDAHRIDKILVTCSEAIKEELEEG
ncbi:HlyC/CorC family transporter [Segetibacter sp. 3557_3]|uniref:hemolysin family protein n=1 Tax=Segetibacter sp. 3557_3 TaxID=2547429 RepID=UPI001058D6C0|nr:hemolysin family protein [Segetibacter sp. 3557_3]TDH29032.1 HlyC/CorC family transporter [Segetibacter sp. 3557_3]